MLEVTVENFCGVAGTLAASRGWGCLNLVPQQVVYNNLGHEER